MGGLHRPSSARKQLEPHINVTPLVDIVLVLLIIFMVITPALAEGEQIELPDIFAPDKEQKDLSPITVTLTGFGTVLVNKQPIDQSALAGKLDELYQQDRTRKVMLKADKALPYVKVRETFALIQRVGFRGVSLKVNKRKPSEA